MRTHPEPASSDPPDSAATYGLQVDGLVEAGMLLGSDLSLPRVLEHLVELAAELTGARYGALGVLAADGTIGEFLTVGMSPEQRRAIGAPPSGRGVLGLLISDPRPLRLDRIEDHPDAVGFPSNHPPMSTFLGAPVHSGGRVFGNIYLTEKAGGGSFSDDDERLLVTLAAQAGIAIANAQSFAELSQRERWLQALHQTTSAMLSGGSVDALLDAIVRVAREMTDSMLSAIVRPGSGPSGRLTVTAFAGPAGHRLEHLELPSSGTASHAVMRTGRPRVVEPGSSQAAWLARAGVAVGPLMVVPLTVRQRIEGTILIARDPSARPFRQEELSLVDSFASQAALAIDYLRIQEQLQRLAVLQERQRIARDIHDDPVQALIYLARKLEALSLADGGVPTTAEVAELRSIAVAVSDGLRQLTEGLRSQTLEEHGLGPALVELGQSFQARTGVAVSVIIDESVGRIGEELERGWLRVAQEALSNVERHAGAGRVVVRLDRRGARVRLAVLDDGVGYRTVYGRARREGMGILGMRERAQLLGGRIRLRSRPGRGALMVADVVPKGGGPGGPTTSGQATEANT